MLCDWVPSRKGGSTVLVRHLLHVNKEGHAFAVALLPVGAERPTEERVGRVRVGRQREHVVVYRRSHDPRPRDHVRVRHRRMLPKARKVRKSARGSGAFEAGVVSTGKWHFENKIETDRVLLSLNLWLIYTIFKTMKIQSDQCLFPSTSSSRRYSWR